MKKYILVLSSVLVFLSTQHPCSAQQKDEQNLVTLDIESVLPPLETIIDSAIAKNPYVKFRDQQIIVNEFKLKSDRIRWMENLGLQSDARYGTFDNFSMNTAAGQTPSVIATRNNQLNYGVGAYIKLPLFDFVNRKHLVGAAKTEMDQAISLAAVQRDELRQAVIKQYNDLILKMKLLKIKSKYLETSHINIQMADKEFKNGVLSVAEYSKISEIVTLAETDYQTVYTEFTTAYMILEELAGFKFKINNILTIKNETK
ncbi:MAG: TolC family protein [Bacteroidia bacterium]|nr:TolC family protein [Bacteroidia bacterium]